MFFFCPKVVWQNEFDVVGSDVLGQLLQAVFLYGSEFELLNLLQVFLKENEVKGQLSKNDDSFDVLAERKDSAELDFVDLPSDNEQEIGSRRQNGLAEKLHFLPQALSQNAVFWLD